MAEGRVVRSAKDAAAALVSALGLPPYSEITIRVVDGKIDILRQTSTVKWRDLGTYILPPGSTGDAMGPPTE